MPSLLTLLFKIAFWSIPFFSNLVNIAILFFYIWCVLHQIYCNFVDRYRSCSWSTNTGKEMKGEKKNLFSSLVCIPVLMLILFSALKAQNILRFCVLFTSTFIAKGVTSAVDLKVTAVLNTPRSSQLKHSFFCSSSRFLCGCGYSKHRRTGTPWKWTETSHSYECLASFVAHVSRWHSSLSLLQ